MRATLSLDDSEYVLTGYVTGAGQNLDGWFVRLNNDGVIFPDDVNTRVPDSGDQVYNLGGVDALYDITPMLDERAWRPNGRGALTN